MAATSPSTVLVVDRGVAAVRVLVSLQRLGIKAVSVHTSEDATALHATGADESVLLGPAVAAYNDVVKLIEAGRQAGVDAVHPATSRLPALEAAVHDAGLAWLGAALRAPVELTVGEGVVEARRSDSVCVLPPVASRCAEVVTGLDLTTASLGPVEGRPRAGVAVSVDVLATDRAAITGLEAPDAPDVWCDLAVEAGTVPIDSLLLVLTAWGADRDAAYARARWAWDQLVITGPTVPRPTALGGTS